MWIGHTHVSDQVARIFHSFDFAQSGQDIQYTPFVAALLETRVAQYEDKVSCLW